MAGGRPGVGLDGRGTPGDAPRAGKPPGAGMGQAQGCTLRRGRGEAGRGSGVQAASLSPGER